MEKFANTRSTKVLRISVALPESQPTPARLLWELPGEEVALGVADADILALTHQQVVSLLTILNKTQNIIRGRNVWKHEEYPTHQICSILRSRSSIIDIIISEKP